MSGGAPLAGKAAHARLLSHLFNAVHISARDVIRTAADEQLNKTTTDLVRHFMRRGELVPDDIVVPLILQVLIFLWRHSDINFTRFLTVPLIFAASA